MDPRPVNIISLFSGIGGLDLGVRLAVRNARTACFVEREVFACATLEARMREGVLDDAPIWLDVSTFDGKPWRGRVSGIVGGFPCQDISNAGKREGIDGKRSGLWSQFKRIIDEVEPEFVFVENVGALIVRGISRVLGDLASIGFHAEWGCFRADEVGAPHRRERVFILAYRDRQRVRQLSGRWNGSDWAGSSVAGLAGEGLAGSESVGCRTPGLPIGTGAEESVSPVRCGVDVADSSIQRRREGWAEPEGQQRGSDVGVGSGQDVADRDDDGQPLVGIGGLLDGQRPACRSDIDGRGCEELADSSRGGSGSAQLTGRGCEFGEGSQDMADTASQREREPNDTSRADSQDHARSDACGRGEYAGIGESGPVVADSDDHESQESQSDDIQFGERPEVRRREQFNTRAGSSRGVDAGCCPGRNEGHQCQPSDPDVSVAGVGLADASDTGLERRACVGRDDGEGRTTAERSRLPYWPPGPDDRSEWGGVMSEHPERAPAIPAQPRIRGMAHGPSDAVELTNINRIDRLRALGNGVVPLVAAHAFITLASRIVED